MKQYQDERELASVFLRILKKLYILRNLDDVPLDLTFRNILSRIMSNQSWAILNVDEQDLLLNVINKADVFSEILSSGNPYLIESMSARLNPYDRVLLKVFRLISENRGSHNDGGFKLRDEDDFREVKKSRSRRVLSWALRALNISDHAVFTKIPLEPAFVEKSLYQYKNALINLRPDFKDVFDNYFKDLDTIKVILNRRFNHLAIPNGIFDKLTPEGEDLYEFLYCLFLRQSNCLSEDYLSQFGPAPYECAKQNFIWILMQKNILDDIENPPYAVKASQVIEHLYSSDVRGLDQKAVDFLNNRRSSFGLFNELMSIADFEEFVRAFRTLDPEDQAFISVLQSIDKFYCEHGYKNPVKDYWYSKDLYDSDMLLSDGNRNRYYNDDSIENDSNEESVDYENSTSYADEDKQEPIFADKQDEHVEAQESRGAVNAQEEPENDYEKAFLALLSHSQDPEFDLSYNRTIAILIKTGFISDPVHPKKYAPQQLFYSLIDKDKLHIVDSNDVKFLIERSLNTAIYLSIFRLDKNTRDRLIDSLRSPDKGFICALLSLEDVDAQKALNESEERKVLEESKEDIHKDEAKESQETCNTQKSVKTEEAEESQETCNTQESVKIEEAEESQDTCNTQESVKTEEAEESQETCNTQESVKTEEVEKLQDTCNTQESVKTEEVEKLQDTCNTQKSADITEKKDPPIIQNKEEAFNLTASILRKLDLCIDLGEAGDGCEFKSLKELFDKLYTLDCFIKLEKYEQLFIYNRRDNLDVFLSLKEKNDPQKTQALEKLSFEDHGFYEYFSKVNFGM